MENYYEKARETAAFIKSKIGGEHKLAVILGSGLGSLVDEMVDTTELDYGGIPNFPRTTVQGHAGKLVSGVIAGKKVLAMKGRFHFYEGYEVPQVVFAVRVFKLLGITDLLVTNAAGGINRSFKPGDLMLIKDHISLFAPSALRGPNIEQFGLRFPDMTEAYSRELIEMAGEAAENCGIQLREGIYAFAQGPMYETPAEIRALHVLGADAVGMSTVPEVVTARHAGIRVLGMSCITNMAAGILDQPLHHEEVMKTANEVEKRFKKLVGTIIGDWQGV